jgi:hypothetical protein
MDHYRCFTVFIIETKRERISDTLAWFPKNVLMPVAPSLDLATAAARDLTNALLHPSPASAIARVSNSQIDTLKQLS